MNTITLPRATVEQALEALELGYDSAKSEADQYHAAFAGYKPQRHAQMDADVQQIAAAITALRAALAQQQANPPGCDHCNHPLYAATRCRVCGRVTEQAEPLGWAVQIGTHSAGRRQGKPRYVLFFNKADAEDLADRTRGARPEPFYLEGQPSRTVPVYTAPPQRKPLTDEEIDAIGKALLGAGYGGNTDREFARAIERAHGIKENAND